MELTKKEKENLKIILKKINEAKEDLDYYIEDIETRYREDEDGVLSIPKEDKHPWQCLWYSSAYLGDSIDKIHESELLKKI